MFVDERGWPLSAQDASVRCSRFVLSEYLSSGDVMNQMNRRSIVKLAAGAAIGAVAATRAGVAESKDQPAEPEKDHKLDMALHSPQNFMFTEKVSFLLDTDGASRDLDVTSALDGNGKPMQVRVPSNCVRVFRADASRDGFTRQGGVYWRFRGEEGKVQFKEAGAVVLIVREDEVVRCYSLEFDMRC
jgi:hypothetical protein